VPVHQEMNETVEEWAHFDGARVVEDEDEGKKRRHVVVAVEEGEFGWGLVVAATVLRNSTS